MTSLKEITVNMSTNIKGMDMLNNLEILHFKCYFEEYNEVLLNIPKTVKVVNIGFWDDYQHKNINMNIINNFREKGTNVNIDKYSND